MRCIYLCIILTNILWCFGIDQALVIVPIVDLMASPIQKIKQNNTYPLQRYADLPFADKDGQCPRIHQLLFNEMVKVVDELDDEICIQIENLYYQTTNGTKHTTYWAEKKNFLLLGAIDTLDTTKLPYPISYHTKYPQQRIITLLLPYQCAMHQSTYSVGTRFVYKGKNNNYYQAYAYNPSTHNIEIIDIPIQLCIDNQKKLTQQQQIELFVKILRLWIQQNGIIPYVWGGISFTKTLPDDVFFEEKIQTITNYQRNDNQMTKAGFDCSGLISRAAQLAGIPYYLKNSTTIAKNLQAVTQYNDIKNGDIIWMPGHVIVISNKDKNLVIEACGYQPGYGKMHEMPLNRVFKGINSFKQLMQNINNKKPIERLTKDNQVYRTVTEMRILALKSAWNLIE